MLKVYIYMSQNPQNFANPAEKCAETVELSSEIVLWHVKGNLELTVLLACINSTDSNFLEPVMVRGSDKRPCLTVILFGSSIT